MMSFTIFILIFSYVTSYDLQGKIFDNPWTTFQHADEVPEMYELCIGIWLCELSQITPRTASHSHAYGGPSDHPSLDSFIEGDISVRGILCDGTGDVYLVVRNDKLRGYISDMHIVDTDDGKYTLEEDQIDYMLERDPSPRMREYENQWISHIRQLNPSRRKLQPAPGEVDVYIHYDICVDMVKKLGEKESARYALELTSWINDVIYIPLGFTLKVRSISFRKERPSEKADSEAYLYAIQEEFTLPADCHLVHHLTTRFIGGGIAFVGGLYDRNYAYAVTGGITGDFSFTDRFVVAHEIGHGFGVGHTHDVNYYDPIIDSCALKDKGHEVPPEDGGTLMSYCHREGVPGNKKPRFEFHELVLKDVYKVYQADNRKLINVDDCTRSDVRLPARNEEFYLMTQENDCVQFGSGPDCKFTGSFVFDHFADAPQDADNCNVDIVKFHSGRKIAKGIPAIKWEIADASGVVCSSTGFATTNEVHEVPCCLSFNHEYRIICDIQYTWAGGYVEVFGESYCQNQRLKEKYAEYMTINELEPLGHGEFRNVHGECWTADCDQSSIALATCAELPEQQFEWSNGEIRSMQCNMYVNDDGGSFAMTKDSAAIFQDFCAGYWVGDEEKLCTRGDDCNAADVKNCKMYADDYKFCTGKYEVWMKKCCSKECGFCDDLCADPSTNPCKNGGMCSMVGLVADCQCNNGFTGDNCEVDPDPCTYPSNPCLNGGSCTVASGSAVCDCIDGWIGKICDVPPNVDCVPDDMATKASCTATCETVPAVEQSPLAHGGKACAAYECQPGDGACPHTPVDCVPNDVATKKSCTKACETVPAVERIPLAHGGAECAVYECQPGDGACPHTPVDCVPNDVATKESCTKACETVPAVERIPLAHGGAACAAYECQPGDGACPHTPVDCVPNDVATKQSCTKACETVTAVERTPLAHGGAACAAYECQPGDGACPHTPVDCVPNDVATKQSCTKVCETVTAVERTPLDHGGAACAAYECQPGDGACLHTPVDCVPNDVATKESCTVACETVTAVERTPLAHGGAACAAYECQPGDGECPLPFIDQHPLYALGTGMECPENYVPIQSQRDCRDAASQLNFRVHKHHFNQWRTIRPRGCYGVNNPFTIFFNHIKTPDSAANGSHILCIYESGEKSLASLMSLAMQDMPLSILLLAFIGSLAIIIQLFKALFIHKFETYTVIEEHSEL